jgi:signal peptidase
MHPSIKHGETITVEAVSPSDVKCGDIALYRHEAGIVVHRVVAIKRTKPEDVAMFSLRGDASATCDQPVRPEQILGKVISVERSDSNINPYSKRAQLSRMAHVAIRGIKGWIHRATRHGPFE